MLKRPTNQIQNSLNILRGHDTEIGFQAYFLETNDEDRVGEIVLLSITV